MAGVWWVAIADVVIMHGVRQTALDDEARSRRNPVYSRSVGGRTDAAGSAVEWRSFTEPAGWIARMVRNDHFGER